MSLTVSTELLAATTGAALLSHRKDAARMRGDREVLIRTDRLKRLHRRFQTPTDHTRPVNLAAPTAATSR